MIELPNDDLVGQVVERRYRIEAPLGRGAMGVVYRARHVKVGREVAIKVLHAHLVRDDAMVARFEREAAVLARLHHKNLVGVIDVGETPAGQRMMVLDLVRGASLATILEDGPLARERVVDLVRQLLRGLAHAHAAGLVHRDLKPENVLVERGSDGVDVARIVDFGIAILCEPGAPAGEVAARRITETGIVLGTPAYMAPEQAHGEAPDPRTDLFALGVMMYEMLAGVQPFDGHGVDVIVANLSREPPPIHRRAPGVTVDPLLEAFARRLMARALSERFASATAAEGVLALIERDREAAAAAFGLVTEMDLTDTAPAHVPPALQALPRARRATLPLPSVAMPAAAPRVPAPEQAVAEPVPVEQAEPVAVAAPGLPWPSRSPALLGCAVFLAGALAAFAFVGG